MSDNFDPYIEWLGISPVEGPADHYSVLGVERFEPDQQKIIAAADERMQLLRKFQNGRRAKQSQEMLNVISGARVCLLDKNRRAEYDKSLRQRIDIKALPEIRIPSPIFPEKPVPVEIFPLKDERVADPVEMFEPPPEPKPSFKLPHIPVWVYFTVIGLASVILMGYALYKSLAGSE